MKTNEVLDELRRTGVHLSRRDLLLYSGLGSAAFGAAEFLAACGGVSNAPATTGTGAATTATTTTSGGATTSTAAAATPASTSTAAQASSGTPKKGGVFTLAIQADPSNNVITQAAALADILVFKVQYNNLTKYQLSQDGKSISVVPDLATKWDTSADLTEYTFTLRDNVTWHDGKPFTADDVKFTYDTVLNPDFNAGGRGNLTAIKSVDVVDPKTVKITTKDPYAYLPVMLGYNQPIFPKHLLQGNEKNPADFIKNPVGTGPFKFKEQVQGNYLRLDANPNYFEGAPYLDSIVYAVIPDGNTRAARLISGDIDFTVIDPPQIDAMQGKPGITVQQVAQVNYYFFAFNHLNPNFKDANVRKAIAHAFDRDAIIKSVLKGYGSQATGPISPLLGDLYNPNVTTYPLDLTKAQDLLTQAGWKKGSDGKLVDSSGKTFDILFNVPSNYPIMVQVVTYGQQQLQKLGFNVTLDVVDWPVHLDKYRNQKYDLLMEWWITPPSPDIYAYYHSQGGNYWKYSNPQVDDLIVKARSEPDPTKRVQLYHDLQTLLADDLPVVFLYYPQEIQAVRRTHDMVKMGYRDSLTWMTKVWVDPK